MLENKEISPLYTDYYQLTMGQAYFKNGRHHTHASFDYFFRKVPFKGSYVIMAGLSELLDMLENLRFSATDIDYLKKLGFADDYLDYLKEFRFRGSIFGMNEGEVVFPTEPILRAEGSILEVQLIETLLLNTLNFQSLIATKASRIRKSAGKGVLSDFGLRRSQSFGGLQASRASIIGGFDNTSNVLAAQIYNIPASGTMAHSFIESFDEELEAFRKYAWTFPDKCVLLVDTYNTLKSGIPNAIQVAKELEKKGYRLAGIRLDSGDLAYLSKKARKILDDEGLDYVKIVASNQLDEHVIKSLKDQEAPIDIFGVGTSMIIGRPDGAIDGVYKLCYAGEKVRLKISENLQKTTLPGKKKVLRYLDSEGMFYADCICLEEEENPAKMIHPFEKEKSLEFSGQKKENLFYCQMKEGKKTAVTLHLSELRDMAAGRLEKLPPEHKRFDFPHIYKVGVSEKLLELRQKIVKRLQDYF